MKIFFTDAKARRFTGGRDMGVLLVIRNTLQTCFKLLYAPIGGYG